MKEKDIIYIEVADKDLDLFEGQYPVPNGITYNSYLILDEKIAIMDTVDKRKVDTFLEKLKLSLKGKTPDYLIISHAEPDHASGIQKLLHTYPDICVIGNTKTFQILSLYLEHPIKNTLTVKEGDILSLGKHRLTFFMAPMVHWPEVMVSYEETTKTLFSADGFGKFGTSNTLDAPVAESWPDEARRYYFNIVGKYGGAVQTLLKKISSLDIQCIAPLHGPMLHAPIDFYLNKYDIWSRYLPEIKGIFIAYASFHGNTALAAHLLKNQLQNMGCTSVQIADLAREDISKAVENAFCYSTLVLAAPSYDSGIMPFMEDFLHHLKAKNFQNRHVAIIENGSWAPCAGKLMTDLLSDMKDITLLSPVLTLRGTLNTSGMEHFNAFAAMLLADIR